MVTAYRDAGTAYGDENSDYAGGSGPYCASAKLLFTRLCAGKVLAQKRFTRLLLDANVLRIDLFYLESSRA